MCCQHVQPTCILHFAANIQVKMYCCACGPQLPFRMYFCREVVEVDRSCVRAFRLNDRKYLGPTSMDAEMAFIMANAALVMNCRVLMLLGVWAK